MAGPPGPPRGCHTSEHHSSWPPSTAASEMLLKVFWGGCVKHAVLREEPGQLTGVSAQGWLRSCCVFNTWIASLLIPGRCYISLFLSLFQGGFQPSSPAPACCRLRLRACTRQKALGSRGPSPSASLQPEPPKSKVRQLRGGSRTSGGEGSIHVPMQPLCKAGASCGHRARSWRSARGPSGWDAGQEPGELWCHFTSPSLGKRL